MDTKVKFKKKVGRPSKKDSINYQGLKLCYSRGFTDEEVALACQITQQTLNNWKKKDSKFFESLKNSKSEADAKVAKSLYQRACGYELADKHYPPDTTACIFWLKNRQPKEWRDVQAREFSGPNGGPIVTKMDTLTDEELLKIATAGGGKIIPA